MIVAHHGGEIPAAISMLAMAVPPLVFVVRARVGAATARLRRRKPRPLD